jgi:endonuclease YncB( thermonuclease family)
VIDGDTVRDLATGRSVRLVGFNAPETHDPRCGEEAELGRRTKARLQDLVGGGTATLTYVVCSCPLAPRARSGATTGGRVASFELAARMWARRWSVKAWR